MNNYITNLGFLIAFIMAAMASRATVITVKQDGTGDYTTIQAGIDAASTSDTVLVWPGVYYENPVCNSKTIVLASLYLTTQDDWYRYNTIIDGNQNGSCMEILGVVNSMEFCGFTLTNGSGHVSGTTSITGGGIYIKNSSPKVNGCIIYENSAWYGGGITIWTEGNVFLSGNTVKYNYAKEGGGGIHITHASSVLFDPVDKNSTFLNHGGYGCDIHKTSGAPALTIPLDTFTVSKPDIYFVTSQSNGTPVNDIFITIETAMIQPVDADIYVSPDGEDSNSGLSPTEPLKTIWFAFKKIEPDTIEQRTIHLLPGTYSPSSNGEMLPVVMRSYVSLEGASKDNTIIDSEYQSSFIRAFNPTKHVLFTDMAMINAYCCLGSVHLNNVYIRNSENIIFRDIIIKESSAELTSGINFEFSINTFVINCLFENNENIQLVFAEVHPFEGYFAVENTVIRSNVPPSGNYGEGGLHIIGSLSPPATFSGKIVNSQITGNIAWPDPSWGGAQGNAIVSFQHNNVNLVNSTIGDNVTKVSFGVAVNAQEGAVLNVYNSILYGDSLREISLGSPLGQNYPATLNMAYSNIEGGEDDIININNQNTINWLSGNIDADPLWEETGDHPYALKAGSPCINTGTPMYEPGMQPPYIIQQDTVYKLITLDFDTIPLPSTDLAGNPRIAYGRIDMGAYEFADTTTQITNHKSQITNNQVTVFPNPFTSNAFISFQTNTKGKVRAAIYNLNGQLVKKLTETEAVPGSYSINWDGTDNFGFEVNPGAYIVSVEVNGLKAGSVKVVKKKRK